MFHSNGLKVTLTDKPMKLECLILNDKWHKNLLYKPPGEKKMEKENNNFEKEAKVLLEKYEDELKNTQERLNDFINYNSNTFAHISKLQEEKHDLTSKIYQLKNKLQIDDEE